MTTFFAKVGTLVQSLRLPTPYAIKKRVVILLNHQNNGHGHGQQNSHRQGQNQNGPRYPGLHGSNSDPNHSPSRPAAYSGSGYAGGANHERAAQGYPTQPQQRQNHGRQTVHISQAHQGYAGGQGQSYPSPSQQGNARTAMHNAHPHSGYPSQPIHPSQGGAPGQSAHPGQPPSGYSRQQAPSLQTHPGYPRPTAQVSQAQSGQSLLPAVMPSAQNSLTEIQPPAPQPSSGFSLASLSKLPNMTEIKGFVDRMGGIDGILSTVTKVQKVVSSVTQMAPMVKVLFGSFGKKGASSSDPGVTVQSPRRRNRRRGGTGTSRPRAGSGRRRGRNGRRR